MSSNTTIKTVIRSSSSARLTADEAHKLIQTQLQRLIHLLEALNPEDWSKPTACTLWSVKDMVAHQAGGYASGTSYREMLRQYRVMLKPGGLPEDAINELQVGERTECSPAELIAELKAAGPIAAQNWAFGFRLIKPIPFPHAIAGWRSLRYLMWVIHSRDTWMHRLDICRATGRNFIQDSQQDGRIVELVMLDVSHLLSKKLQGKTIQIDLSGPAGGTWLIGTGNPEAIIQVDALDFNIYISGRSPFEVIIDQVEVTGNKSLALEALRDLLILY